MRVTHAVGVVLFLTSSLASSALAQSEPSPAYTALAQRATTAIAEERLDDALMLFRELHAMSPSARTLWSLGRVHFERGEYVLAHDHLRAGLDDERRPLDVAQRASATELLRTAANLIARVQVRTVPADAAVIVDDVQVSERELRLDAGAHELRFEAPGFETSSRRLELRGGEVTELTVELSEAQAGASVGILAALQPAGDPTAPREVQLEVRGEPGYRLFLRPAVDDDGRPFGEGDATFETEARGAAMTGVYRAAVQRPDGTIAAALSELPILADTVLSVDYADNSASRIGGWIVVALALAGLGAIGASIGLFETNPSGGLDTTSRDWAEGLLISGIIGASVGLLGFAFPFIEDEGVVRIQPQWDAAGRL